MTESGGLKLVFMGSPDFSVSALAALIDAGHEIVCVYAQPPRPAGRGQKQRPCAVHAYALAHDLDVRTPASLKDAAGQQAFADLQSDAAVVVAYGLILPKPVLAAPRLGCFNIHASLLPRWRGAAPIQRAIIAGDSQTGVTIMQMDEGLDTGAMLNTESIAITGTTTASDLHDRLADMGARLIVETLKNAASATLTPEDQDDSAATYAAKLSRPEGRIDWTLGADELERRVRALNPWPGVWFELNGKRIKVLAADVIADGVGAPGEVLDDQMTVACATGGLRPRRVQIEGKGPCATQDFLRGHDLTAGMRLG
ncbi:MAG: methionyl-tRNA formyltransferase [Alphaproteobacteria bacterium]